MVRTCKSWLILRSQGPLFEILESELVGTILIRWTQRKANVMIDMRIPYFYRDGHPMACVFICYDRVIFL